MMKVSLSLTLFVKYQGLARELRKVMIIWSKISLRLLASYLLHHNDNLFSQVPIWVRLIWNSELIDRDSWGSPKVKVAVLSAKKRNGKHSVFHFSLFTFPFEITILVNWFQAQKFWINPYSMVSVLFAPIKFLYMISRSSIPQNPCPFLPRKQEVLFRLQITLQFPFPKTHVHLYQENKNPHPRK